MRRKYIAVIKLEMSTGEYGNKLHMQITVKIFSRCLSREHPL